MTTNENKKSLKTAPTMREYVSITRSFTTLAWAVLTLMAIPELVSGLSVPPDSPGTSGTTAQAIPEETAAQIRIAMVHSQMADRNITAAYQACDRWSEIFGIDANELIDGPSPHNWEPTIQALCYAFYATSLVRIGKDDIAERVYAKALQFQNQLPPETKEDLMLGRAQALQRLLRYDDAVTQFLESMSSESVLGAATCSLRLRRVDEAISILQRHDQHVHGENRSHEVRGMLASLILCSETHKSDGSWEQILASAGKSNLLYQWIATVLGHTNEARLDLKSAMTFIDLIKINQSPFDDPGLLQLDDKVMLQNFLADNNKIQGKKKHNSPNVSSFWPAGFIVPTQMTLVRGLPNDDADTLWIFKRRSGYGSHGNQIVKLRDVVMEGDTTVSPSHMAEEALLQKMVHPPLLLNDRRKFSLRIYVVTIGGSYDKIYISTKGLVKIASHSVPENEADTVDSAQFHMTNSGRDEGMVQYGLNYLEDYFNEVGWSFSDFWKKVTEATQTVFESYAEDTSKQRKMFTSLTLPKILGLDFVVDSNLQPWLIEVNRFPGLEPRDAIDREVKYSVVRQAWQLAIESTNLADASSFKDMLETFSIDEKGSDDQILTPLRII